MFSNLKRWFMNTLHGVRRQRLRRYLDGFAFRWTGIDDASQGQPGNSERTLIYDPTGHLAAEVGTRNLPDEPAVKRSVQHLFGRF